MTTTDFSRAAKIGIAALVYLIAFMLFVAHQNEALGSLTKTTELAVILGSALVMVIVTALWASSIGMVSPKGEALAPSVKKSRNTLLLSGIFGGLIGLAFVLSEDLSRGGSKLFTNEPISPLVAIIFSIAFAGACIYGAIRWNRTADEHEKAAATAGAYAGVYTYAILAPVWWLAERASLVPPQEPMIVFAIVLTVYAAVWTYKRGE